MARFMNNSGFTMVELVVTIAIIAVLATFAVPAYNEMSQNAMVRTATDSIVTGLQTARAEAVKRNEQVQFDFTTGSGWSVTVVNDGTVISTRAQSDGSSANVTVATNIAGPYVFDGMGLLTTGALTVNVDNSALTGARNLRVVVGAGGAIKSCDPALDPSGDDPRKC